MDFKHGGDVYSAADAWGVSTDQIRDFSANINPYGFDAALFKATANNLQAVAHYPDTAYRQLRRVLSEHYNIDAENIIVGNGGIELIYRGLQALAPARVGILAPTFIEYERAAVSLGAELAVFETGAYDFRPAVEAMIAFASGVDVFFICNPNNPTGVLYSADDLSHLIRSCPDTVFIVDEAFMDFVPDQGRYSLLSRIDAKDNLLVIRSMTKMYSMPGLRLGFLYAWKQELLDSVRRVINPWNVNSLVSNYMVALLEDKAFVPLNHRELAACRQELIDALSQLPDFTVYDSAANYVFFRYVGSIEWISALEPYHVLIRDCSNYRGLGKGDFRIAVKSAPDNGYLIHAMQTISKEFNP